jgi:ribose transport system ATP-binding protein
MEKKKVLEIRGVSKSFSGVTVFADFDFDVYSGEVHCLCGENGAGKSTFIKILSGAYQPDEGSITIDGEQVVGKLNPALSMEKGIQTIYQEHTLMLNQTVWENLFVGKEIMKGMAVDRKAMYARTLDILKAIGVEDINPLALVRDLGTAQQKYVEIAKAFIKEAKVMIMDEPTASFSAHEVKQLLDVVNRLKDSGVGVIYISHHLEEIFDIATRVTVIRDGRKISTYNKADGLNEAMIIKDMVGRDASTFYSREPVEVGEKLFEVTDLSGVGVDHVSFALHRGEIVGVAGLVGSGRTEMAETIFGKRKATGGRLFLNGKEIRIRSPKEAIGRGLCMVTEDRQLTGLCVNQPLTLNSLLPHSVKYSSFVVNPKTETKKTVEYIKKLNVKCKGPYQQAKYLSGGNQQKVVFSKWFITDGDVFVFDEPTRGVDVGAKQDIYRLMIELCKAGKGILMISSDMPEVVAMSDRVIVMRDGKVSAEVSKENIREETILGYALGGALN